MAIPSASEQHRPLPLLRLSNHGFKGDPEYRPSSRAIALPTMSVVTNTRISDVLNELGWFTPVTDATKRPIWNSPHRPNSHRLLPAISIPARHCSYPPTPLPH